MFQSGQTIISKPRKPEMDGGRHHRDTRFRNTSQTKTTLHHRQEATPFTNRDTSPGTNVALHSLICMGILGCFIAQSSIG